MTMAPEIPPPFFLRAGGVVQNSTGTSNYAHDFHFDLLSFLSISRRLEVDLVKVTWQPGLERLGRGATSAIQQAQIDRDLNLAFKRSVPWSTDVGVDTEHLDKERFKALIFELIALESLRRHPCVIDLLGITWETDPDTSQVWPVLLTERSEFGTMAEFLASTTGQGVSLENRLRLCGDVASACQAMHKLG